MCVTSVLFGMCLPRKYVHFADFSCRGICEDPNETRVYKINTKYFENKRRGKCLENTVSLKWNRHGYRENFLAGPAYS